MKGFKITCIGCGKETIYTQGNYDLDKDNDNIDICIVTYDRELAIVCDCGNDIDETYKGE